MGLAVKRRVAKWQVGSIPFLAPLISSQRFYKVGAIISVSWMEKEALTNKWKGHCISDVGFQ